MGNLQKALFQIFPKKQKLLQSGQEMLFFFIRTFSQEVEAAELSEFGAFLVSLSGEQMEQSFWIGKTA